jgi:hypothetical protein
MVTTGWIGEEPDAAGPALPVTNLMLSMRQRAPGDVLENALARSRAAEARQAREEAATARDPDEYAANLVTRGYTPGLIHGLSQRLADTMAELEEERAKIAKGERRMEHVRGLLERGQVGGLDAAERMDGDFGDPAQAERLERRVESLRAQIADVTQIMVPPEARARNAVEEASLRAQRILAEVAAERRAEDEAEVAGRARMASERAAFYAARGERRPFASRGDADAAGEDAWERERALRAAVSGVSYR